MLTITEEALEHLKSNPSTMAAIADRLGKSQFTVAGWLYRAKQNFTTPAVSEIIAKRMGKKVSEILTEQTEKAA